MHQRQIVVKFPGKQIEYPVDAKDAITRIHSLTWIFIFVNVTTQRTVSLQSYETSHFIMMTTKLLRSSI
jgi:hypothetical protein